MSSTIAADEDIKQRIKRSRSREGVNVDRPSIVGGATRSEPGVLAGSARFSRGGLSTVSPAGGPATDSADPAHTRQQQAPLSHDEMYRAKQRARAARGSNPTSSPVRAGAIAAGPVNDSMRLSSTTENTALKPGAVAVRDPSLRRVPLKGQGRGSQTPQEIGAFPAENAPLHGRGSKGLRKNPPSRSTSFDSNSQGIGAFPGETGSIQRSPKGAGSTRGLRRNPPSRSTSSGSIPDTPDTKNTRNSHNTTLEEAKEEIGEAYQGALPATGSWPRGKSSRKKLPVRNSSRQTPSPAELLTTESDEDADLAAKLLEQKQQQQGQRPTQRDQAIKKKNAILPYIENGDDSDDGHSQPVPRISIGSRSATGGPSKTIREQTPPLGAPARAQPGRTSNRSLLAADQFNDEEMAAEDVLADAAANKKQDEADINEPLVEAYVVADDSASKQEEPKYSRSRFIPRSAGDKLLCFGMACLVTLLILAGMVVGIVCASGACSGGGDSKDSDTAAPVVTSSSPVGNTNTSAPTTMPPPTTGPSLAPSPPLVEPPTLSDLFLPITPESTPAPTALALTTNNNNSSSEDPDIFVLVPVGDSAFVLLPASTQDALGDPESPQSKALDWLTKNYDTIAQLAGGADERQLQAVVEDWRLQQLFALATIYYAFNGPSWKDEAQDSWLDPAVSECVWNQNRDRLPRGMDDGEYPIECNGAGKIKTLILHDLTDSSLSATMPVELGLITSLDFFAVTHTPVKSTLPAMFPLAVAQDLIKLEGLRLNILGVAGTIPTYFGSMSLLTELLFTRNQVSGFVPSQLGSLTLLTNLRASENRLTGTIPASLKALARLQDLSFDYNMLNQTIPTVLGELTALARLELQGNQLTGTIPSELGRLTALKYLRLQWNKLTGVVPESVCNLTWISDLKLEMDCEEVSCPDDCKCICHDSDDPMEEESVNPPNSTGNSSEQDLESGVDDNELPADDVEGEADLYSILPEYTLASLEDEESAQFRALEWMLESFEPLALQQMEEWRKKQLFAMATLYFSLNVEEWKEEHQADWLDPQLHECKWNENPDLNPSEWKGGYPIHCEEEVVKRLYFWMVSDDEFECVIPPEIALLSQLEAFQFRKSKLVGKLEDVVPPQVTALTSLQDLKLSVNRLTGTIPTYLFGIPDIKELTMGQNQLNSTIPSEIGLATTLELLFLSYNTLMDTIPLELARLTNITSLEMRHTELNSTIPSELGLLTQLTSLSLSTNQLRGQIPSELGQLTALPALKIHVNDLTGTMPQEICDAPMEPFVDCEEVQCPEDCGCVCDKSS